MALSKDKSEQIRKRKKCLAMRLTKIREFMDDNHMPYQYFEDNGCGSINFIHRGLSYRIWEFNDPEWGAESNIRTCGRSEDFTGNYEEDILEILKTW